MPEIKYKRILLKLSGEALGGAEGRGVNAGTLGKICDQIKNIVNLGVEVAIVVGGGNFWSYNNEWFSTSRFARSKRTNNKTSNSN